MNTPYLRAMPDPGAFSIAKLIQREGVVVDDFRDTGAWFAGFSTTPTLAAGGDAEYPNTLSITTPSGTLAGALRPMTFSFEDRRRFLSLKIKSDANTAYVRVSMVYRSRTSSQRRWGERTFDAKGLTPGEWELYTVGAADLTGYGSPASMDFTAVYVSAQPTAGTTTTVEITDMRVHEDLAPPGVIWTFDDGASTDYTKAMPALAAAGYTGTCYINSSTIGSSVSGSPRMTLTQLQDLKSLGWSIGSHTATHFNLGDISAAQRDSELSVCFDYLATNGLLDRTGSHFAYPSGSFNSDAVRDTLRYHRTARTTGIGVEKAFVANRGRLRCRGFDNNMSVAQAKTHLDNVVRYGGVMVVMIHQLYDDGATTQAHEWYTSRLTEAAAYAAQIGLQNYTFDDVFA